MQISTEQKQAKNKRFMHLSRNTKIKKHEKLAYERSSAYAALS
jgi:hypothetical protein